MFLIIGSINAQLGTYQFQEISSNNYISFLNTTAVFSGGNFDTEDAPNIPIGFDFKYAGQTYNSLTISVDGAISFTENNVYGGNNLASTTTHHTNIIAPFWDDLELLDSDNGIISYKAYGTAPNRGFVVEWRNIRRYNHTGTMTFRLFIKETTNYIKFQYGSSNLNFSNASIGFNAKNGSTTTFVSVTPGTPASVSTSTANNDVSNTSYPSNKIYIFSPRPANDLHQNAIQITLNNCAHPISAYNAGASYSSGNTPTCGGYAGNSTRDIWYKFTAPQRGAIKITRKNAGDWSSISYAIQHGTNINNPIVVCDWIPTENTSKEIYNLIPGDIYYIRMWDYANNDFGYAYFCVESLDNDSNSYSFPITVQPENASSYVETYANNNGATSSPNATPACGNYQGGDVWFNFTAPANGKVAVVHSDTAGDWSSLAFAVYGSAGSNSAIDCDMIRVSGFTAPYEVKIISGLTAGTTYYLRTWDFGNDNFGSSPFYLREDTTSGIEDYTNLDFKYYPNPATNVLNINAKNEISSITLTNMMGQQVLSVTPNTQETTINIAHLPQGVYMMNVLVGDNTKTVKIIKK